MKNVTIKISLMETDALPIVLLSKGGVAQTTIILDKLPSAEFSLTLLL